MFGEYVKHRRTELAQLNEATVSSRLISLEQSFTTKVAKKEQQLVQAREKKSPGRYIQMLEGTLRRLRLEYQKRREEIEQGRKLDLSFERIASGIVRVE